MKRGNIYFQKKERNKKKKWGEKGKVMKKGKEKRRGGADGEYGESVRSVPAFDIAG